MKLLKFMNMLKFMDKKFWLIVLFIVLLIVFYILTQYNQNEGFLTCIQGKTRVNNAVAGLCAAQTDSDKAKARDELDIELEKFRNCMDYSAGVAAYQASNSGSSGGTSQPNAACISAR